MGLSSNKKIQFVCTNEWFFESHFIPLNDAALSLGDIETSLIAKPKIRDHEQEKPKINVVPCSFERSRLNPGKAVSVISGLSQAFRREQADLIHFIALRPIILGGLSNLLTTRSAAIYHLTGTGLLSLNTSFRKKWIFSVCLKIITLLLKQQNSFLIVENENDLTLLKRHGKVPVSRTKILGGAGVDPTVFNDMPLPAKAPLRLSYVGRMVWSKGVDILVEAANELEAKNHNIQFELYGQPDKGNPRSVNQQTLDSWNQMPNVSWHGYTNDIVSVWAKSDIAIIPSRGGEGLPRSLLEAASCARPLVVTDVPGCRHFVRDGIEGFVVPPEDPKAIANAIEILIHDPDLRRAMGKAARQRVLAIYTEDHIRQAVSSIYRKLLNIEEKNVVDEHKPAKLASDIAV